MATDGGERIRQTEDAARRSVSTLAGLLLGFSLLALQWRPGGPILEWRAWLIASWVFLGLAVFFSTMHDLLMTRWVRNSDRDYACCKCMLNVLSFLLLIFGLSFLLTFAALNVL